MPLSPPAPPNKLYKYRQFNEYTLQLFYQTEVYYANPRSFNDPFDSNPEVVQDLSLPELERLFCVIATARHGTDKAKTQIEYHRFMSAQYGDYKTDTGVRNYYTANLAKSLVQLLRQGIDACGVLSLASRWDCPLMWSHYANEHRGLCIEYSTKDACFSDLGKVNYQGSRAIRLSDVFAWKVNGDQSAKDSVRATIYLSKAPDWKYEQEWRDLTNKAGSRPAPAPPSSILFGYRCSSTIIYTIVQLFKNAEFPVQFYLITPQKETFRLERHPIDPENEILSDRVRLPAGSEFREAF